MRKANCSNQYKRYGIKYGDYIINDFSYIW